MEIKIKAEEFESKEEKKLLKKFCDTLEKQMKPSNLGKKIINISKKDILDEAYDFFDIHGAGKMAKLIKKIFNRDIKLAIEPCMEDTFTGIVIIAYAKNKIMTMSAELKDGEDDKYVVDIVSREERDEKVSRPEGMKKIEFKVDANKKWWANNVVIED